MNKRVTISTLLVLSAVILALFPGVGKYSFLAERNELVSGLFAEDRYMSVDRVADYVVSEDPSVQLIDLRAKGEYLSFNIPGSINVPIDEFFKSKPESFLYNKDIDYIFYSNSNISSSSALSFSHGLGYSNTYVMEGGLNEWYKTIMSTTYNGEMLTPRQNRLFETRTKARKFFTEINSLPDSLRIKYAESRRQAEKDLDGGCE